MKDKVLYLIAIALYTIQIIYLLPSRFSLTDYFVIAGTTFLAMICLILGDYYFQDKGVIKE